MKKRVFMSLVVLAIVGTSAVFAQQPTLDKLKITNSAPLGGLRADPVNDQISGAVVIPDTYNGNPVIAVGVFRNTGITSIVIPASVIHAVPGTFTNCTNLTSVTFQGTTPNFGNYASDFPGDLRAKYNAGGAGTYTRPAGSNTWTKQGGYTLSGTYTRSDGTQITITEDGKNVTITGNYPNNGGRINRALTDR
jgi:hypothetical protein